MVPSPVRLLPALLAAWPSVAGAFPSLAQDTAHVVIVATTDLGGHVTAWDYAADQVAPWGLSRAATVLDSLRQRYPAEIVLVDAGGALQGGLFARYFAGLASPPDPYPVVDGLNALAYDAATLGNHDFDFGLDVMGRAVGSAAYPMVSANVYRLPRDTLAFQRYVVLRRGPIGVGLTGFTTPGVMVWNQGQVKDRIAVRRIIPEARRTMALLRNAGAELTVILMHSGLDSPAGYDTTGIGGENVATQLAFLPNKPDIVVLGHTRGPLRDSVIAGVHFLQPPAGARGLTVAHVWLGKVQNMPPPGDYRVARVETAIVPLDRVPPAPWVQRRFQEADRMVRVWGGATVARVSEQWSTRRARVEDTPIMDFVNEALRRRSGAQLAASAVYDLDLSFGPGAARVRDLQALAPSEHTLRAVAIDGATLHAYLEHAVSYFRTYRAEASGGSPFADDIAGMDYDVVSGIDYTVDLSQPPGARIVQTTYQGRLVQPTDTFTLALDSYRQQGGGGYSMLRGLKVVYDRGERIVDILDDVARRAGVLRSYDYFRPSWRLIPPAAAEWVRRSLVP